MNDADNPTNTDAPQAAGRDSQMARDVALGFDMERFRESPMGRYFAERASANILDDMNALKAVDIFAANGPAEVARLQQSIRVAEQFFVWIHDAIESGKDASSQLALNDAAPVDPIG